jgi:hypothetical protein
MQFLSHDNRATLNEIRQYFSGEGYDIYRLDADTQTELLVVVDINGDVFATFEPIVDMPSLYQVYELDYDVAFSEVAHLWADTITLA